MNPPRAIRGAFRTLFAFGVVGAIALIGGCGNSSDKGSSGAASSTTPAGPNPALTDVSKANEKAPDVYKVRFTTTKGDFVVEARREWSPGGADRFYNLVKIGFYDGVKFFRVIDGFMAQFGIHGSPKVMSAWRSASIVDDPVVQGNKRGFLSFAMAGKNSRTTQLFINLVDNQRLDKMGFAAFAQVVEGMNVVDSLYKGYGEGAPQGKGPDQGRLQMEGNAYLEKDFPQLDGIVSAKLVQ
ncbi:MAG: peptidylprolyl isomerase [Polyangiaceae bacterium]